MRALWLSGCRKLNYAASLSGSSAAAEPHTLLSFIPRKNRSANASLASGKRPSFNTYMQGPRFQPKRGIGKYT